MEADEHVEDVLGDGLGRDGVDGGFVTCGRKRVRSKDGAGEWEEKRRTRLLLPDLVEVAVLAKQRGHVAEDGKLAEVDRLGRFRLEKLLGVGFEAVCGRDQSVS